MLASWIASTVPPPLSQCLRGCSAQSVGTSGGCSHRNARKTYDTAAHYTLVTPGGNFWQNQIWLRSGGHQMLAQLRGCAN